jgi:hypothetical protein
MASPHSPFPGVHSIQSEVPERVEFSFEEVLGIAKQLKQLHGLKPLLDSFSQQQTKILERLDSCLDRIAFLEKRIADMETNQNAMIHATCNDYKDLQERVEKLEAREIRHSTYN